ncbi:hypothetical protein EMPG_15967 [Blastomyces silverae]|uniref:Uncharacterized protein n=1 Tax=Blastomyces silverae TaxID=2060906 RepID=A0A0H1BHE8_9EURO|nr:hypothetical protein EMPG_15967 [Blastomyces silverae]
MVNMRHSANCQATTAPRHPIHRNVSMENNNQWILGLWRIALTVLSAACLLPHPSHPLLTPLVTSSQKALPRTQRLNLSKLKTKLLLKTQHLPRCLPVNQPASESPRLGP